MVNTAYNNQKLYDQWFAYHVLTVNPDMLNLGTEYDTDYQLLYNDLERSDAGTAMKIDDALHNYDYATASAYNASLSSATAWSRNLKFANDISLTYANKTAEELPTDLVETLTKLAYQSSVVVGPAAFKARGLLGLSITDPEYRADNEPAVTYTEQAQVYVVVTPNPSDGQISVGRLINGTGDYTIEVFNALGQVVHSSQLGSNAYRTDLNLTDLPGGIYLYHIRAGNDNLQTGKLVIR